MSPEYAIEGLFLVKSDVFSFGVLVLEIISGKRKRGFYHSNHDMNLLGHVSLISFISVQTNLICFLLTFCFKLLLRF